MPECINIIYTLLSYMRVYVCGETYWCKDERDLRVCACGERYRCEDRKGKSWAFRLLQWLILQHYPDRELT